jgi:AcrR family transcriptional regulator
MKSTRAYRMVARAEAAAATEERIRHAALALFMAHDYSDVTLEDIAARAGVAMPTVLRRFGSKARLLDAVSRRRAREIFAEREPVVRDDAGAAIASLCASYERMGDAVWRALRQEHLFVPIHKVLARARQGHRRRLAATFASWLPKAGAERERRLQLLFCATDYYQWKLLRQDLGVSARETRRTMLGLVDALLRSFSTNGKGTP